MLPEVCVMLCAVLAFQITAGLCLPSGMGSDLAAEKNQIPKLPDEQDDHEKEDTGYQVILKSPTHFLKVEVVDDTGNTTLQQLLVESEEDLPPSAPSTPKPPALNKKSRSNKRPRSRSSDRKTQREVQRYRCDWRRLYKLYLNRRRVQSESYSKAKRSEIRRAFKIVCENPEDTIKILLDMDSIDD